MTQTSTSNKKIIQNKTNVQCGRKLLGWDVIIHDAKRRIKDLQYSIAVCERKKAAGEPWPRPQRTEQHAR